jgi:hypothetical protein
LKGELPVSCASDCWDLGEEAKDSQSLKGKVIEEVRTFSGALYIKLTDGTIVSFNSNEQVHMEIE